MPCLSLRGNAFASLPRVERIFRGLGNGEYAVEGGNTTKPAGEVPAVAGLEEFRVFFGNDVVEYDSEITAGSSEGGEVFRIELKRIGIDHRLHEPIPGLNGDFSVDWFCGGRQQSLLYAPAVGTAVDTGTRIGVDRNEFDVSLLQAFPAEIFSNAGNARTIVVERQGSQAQVKAGRSTVRFLFYRPK